MARSGDTTANALVLVTRGHCICLATRPAHPPPPLSSLAQMCILSGSDFLAGLQGIGVRKAHGYVRKYKGFVKVRRSQLVLLAGTMRSCRGDLKGGGLGPDVLVRLTRLAPTHPSGFPIVAAAGQGPALQRSAGARRLRERLPARDVGLPALQVGGCTMGSTFAVHTVHVVFVVLPALSKFGSAEVCGAPFAGSSAQRSGRWCT